LGITRAVRQLEQRAMGKMGGLSQQVGHYREPFVSLMPP
jgi:hypothetical protein